MATARILLFVLLCCLVTSCNLQKKEPDSSPGPQAFHISPAAETKGSPAATQANLQQSIDRAQPSQASDRKIIRNAEIAIEMGSPKEAQPKVAAIAQKYGGFVVTSEFRQNGAAAQSSVNVILRVPAQNFETVIGEIYGVGGHVLNDTRSGQDVTEEYVDLEARLRAKRALEIQFLEIMKQAHKVSDALEVQSQLGEVRTEIERLEGRRRFLENQAALSTIRVSLSAPPPVVTATTRGFFNKLKTAFGDGVDIGSEIVLDIVRFAIVMIPVTVFILVPLWFIFRWLVKRIRWSRPVAVPSVVSAGD